MPRVTTEIEGHIAHVTLTRPDKMNAVDPEMAEAIVAAGAALMEADIRAVVLSGEGRTFCAGLDVMSFATLARGDPEALILKRTHGTANLFQQVAMVWHRLKQSFEPLEHNKCSNITFGGMFKRPGQTTHYLKAEFTPEPDSNHICRWNKIKLHRLVTQLKRHVLRMLTHGRGQSSSSCLW